MAHAMISTPLVITPLFAAPERREKGSGGRGEAAVAIGAEGEQGQAVPVFLQ